MTGTFPTDILDTHKCVCVCVYTCHQTAATPKVNPEEMQDGKHKMLAPES